MNEDYVVLRIPGVKNLEVLAERTRGVPRSAAVPAGEIRVETLSGVTPKAARDLERDPAVLAAPEMPIELVEPVEMEASDAGDAVPEDSGPVAWGLEATRVTTSPFSGKGVVVAVLDTGIDAGHEAFAGRKIVQEDFTGEGNGDLHGHGTHCAGTIFGGTVGGVRIGIATGIEKALVGKVLNQFKRGTTRQAVNGLFWAVSEGANIVSMSLGFDFAKKMEDNVGSGMPLPVAASKALEAYRKNVALFDQIAGFVEAHSEQFEKAIVIAAAGNQSKRPEYEISTAPPAVARGFISVGALARAAGNRFKVASFSNALPRIAAPGVDIRSAKNGGGLVAKNGTSQAAPHVAGIAALWMEAIAAETPSFHMSEVRGRVTTGSRQGIDMEDRPNAGAGLVLAPPPQ